MHQPFYYEPGVRGPQYTATLAYRIGKLDRPRDYLMAGRDLETIMVKVAEFAQWCRESGKSVVELTVRWRGGPDQDCPERVLMYFNEPFKMKPNGVGEWFFQQLTSTAEV